MSWQNLAISIEDVVNQCPDFIGAVPFDLGRSRSFYVEYTGSAKFESNIRLQNSLTIRQLQRLKLDDSANNGTSSGSRYATRCHPA